MTDTVKTGHASYESWFERLLITLYDNLPEEDATRVEAVATKAISLDHSALVLVNRKVIKTILRRNVSRVSDLSWHIDEIHHVAHNGAPVSGLELPELGAGLRVAHKVIEAHHRVIEALALDDAETCDTALALAQQKGSDAALKAKDAASGYPADHECRFLWESIQAAAWSASWAASPHSESTEMAVEMAVESTAWLKATATAQNVASVAEFKAVAHTLIAALKAADSETLP